MSDQFASIVAANRAPLTPGTMLLDSPFGQYLFTPGEKPSDEILRLRTNEQLQTAWCVNKACWQNCEDDMNANAIACKRFNGDPETQHLADRHAERHQYHAQAYGRWENACVSIQEEMQWRLDNPAYDPEDPFCDE